jgi:lycopene beta-cyclase
VTPQFDIAQFDIVIAGGGLSGLSMAVALAQPRFSHLKILLVEPRTHYTRDRTWSFWADGAKAGPHPHQHLQRASWARWRVAHRGQEAVCSGQHSYCSIDADAFYDDALATVRAAAHIELRLGAGVVHISPDWPCQVVLDDGQRVHTSLVFDARATSSGKPPALAQHFAGWEIEAESDVFTTDTLDLMDFVPASDGLHFFYVLPYGPRRALVEATWVSAPGLHHDYAAQLERYVEKRFGALRYRRVYEEQGSLGLDPVAALPNSGPRLKIGRAAGTLRPSTGFAFRETVADCARLAQQIAHCRFPISSDRGRRPLTAFRRSAVDRFMDAWFMRVLASDWRTAPDIFMALFSKTPSDCLVRFLSGQASWADRAAVAASLPKRRFALGLWQSFIGARQEDKTALPAVTLGRPE